jgi:hypothetical protein
MVLLNQRLGWELHKKLQLGSLHFGCFIIYSHFSVVTKRTQAEYDLFLINILNFKILANLLLNYRIEFKIQ